jgi:hypothetical protein
MFYVKIPVQFLEKVLNTTIVFIVAIMSYLLVVCFSTTKLNPHQIREANSINYR